MVLLRNPREVHQGNKSRTAQLVLDNYNLLYSKTNTVEHRIPIADRRGDTEMVTLFVIGIKVLPLLHMDYDVWACISINHNLHIDAWRCIRLEKTCQTHSADVERLHCSRLRVRAVQTNLMRAFLT